MTSSNVLKKLASPNGLLWVAAAVFVGVTRFAQADPLNVGNGAVFRLDADSSFQEGCFDPCACPIWISESLRGTFWPAYLGSTATGHHAYSVEDVNLIMVRGGEEVSVIGAGQYSIRFGIPGSPLATEHRMELDLQVGSDPVDHYDSGWVPRSNNNFGIDLALSINGMYCYDRVVDLSANRVTDSEITRYTLSPGATFQRGCWDPCDCPLGPEQPMIGTFLLVPLSANPLFQEFAVLRARWVVPAASNVGGLVLTGFGRYFVGGEVAVMQRLTLEMVVGSEPRAHFDSGYVGGGGLFPHIDVTTFINGMVCFDTALHVIADPESGQVCGGFAGFPCPPGQFCKLPVGSCCCDFQGVCTPIPGGCPDVWDPVCGCDGVTYGNECEVDAAGMSIDHFGACSAACGPNQLPCPPNSFCKLPTGVCDSTQPGSCTEIPGGCPAIWDPVCGCNDITYDNECAADRAGVSVAHDGPCNVNVCSATRYLTGPSIADYTYCPGTEENVIIALTPPAGASAIALEDGPPAGWVVTYINGGGAYDSVHHKVKWGPFFAPFPGNVSYGAMPPNDTSGPKCFNGTISVDGATQTICGDTCLSPCCLHMAADSPQAACGACPAGGCGGCNSAACDDGRVSLCEVIAYACEWMQGCNDDLAGMTRAAYIWRNGECYCWDAASGMWHPSACDPAGNVCCGSAEGDVENRDLEDVGHSALAVMRPVGLPLRKRDAASASYRVTVLLDPRADTSASAAELNLPAGWELVRVLDGGRFDENHAKVKWGPFMDGDSHKVSLIVRPPQRPHSTRFRTPRPNVSAWSGWAAFDGEVVAIEIQP